MKKPLVRDTPTVHIVRALLALAGGCSGVNLYAAPLYSEPFDSAATAKVTVNKLADADLAYVNYASFVRDQSGAGGPVTLSIPEAPNRLPGSAATRGVLLNATYGGTARTINLLASATPAGAATVFSGNDRMAFDMWLAVDPTGTAGTTEVGLFGIGHSGTTTISYSRRAAGVGTFGWLSAEGGIGGSGDMSLYIGGTAAFVTENIANAGLYGLAFPQGSIYTSTPNNQWTQVELVAVGTKVTVYMNGAKFGETTNPANISGFASIGYEDPFTGSTPSITGGSPRYNKQFGLFDNLTVDSLAGPPSLEAVPFIVFTPVTTPLQTTSAEFTVNNTSTTAQYQVLSAVIDGANAPDFALATTFPVTVPALETAPVVVNFDPATPNGLKVARLTLTTTDPNQPLIRLPLQARRAINSIEAAVTTRIVSVAVQNGTGTGQLTITNNGTAPVTVNAPVFSGVDAAMFSITGTFPLEIPVAAVVTLPIIFTPAGTRGLKSASADFTTNDPGVPTLNMPLLSRYAFGPPLLAHYKMDDTSGTTLVDSTATSPAAALQIREIPFGFAQPSLLPGGAGTAVRLTAADSSTTGNFAISAAVHLPNVSYSLWIKPEAKPTTNRRILHRSSLFTTVGTLYSLYLTPAGKLVFEVNSATAVETADGAIADGTAYHIAITHSDLDAFGNTTATRTRLYVNGVMIAEKAIDAVGFTDYNLNTTAEGLYIGTATSAGQGYIGMMDDLQIYSVELTPEQIAGIYSQPGRTAFNLETLNYRITAIQYNPGTGAVTLSWNSTAGAVYSVQESTTTSGFTNVPGQTGIASGGVTTSATFTATAGPRRFFQIRRTSPP